MALLLAREYGNFSFPEIGASFGGKDHSTAIHAVKKIEKELKDNPEISYRAVEHPKAHALLRPGH